MREVDEELGATISDLVHLTTLADAPLTESDGSVVPVVWRPLDDMRR